MKFASLRLRLLLAAAVAIVFAVGVTGIILVFLFTKYIENRVYGELESHLQQLTEGLSVSPQGTVSVEPLADQRFAQPFSGYYWQAATAGKDLVLSRSLWDEGFNVPAAEQPGQMRRIRTAGPQDEELLLADWAVAVKGATGERLIHLAVASHRVEIAAAASAFGRDLALWLGLLAIALLLAASVQVGVGLSPLEVLRNRVSGVRAGDAKRLDGDYPREVSPLVDELNALLQSREASIADARARAGDLAHGLKTPLTVLGAVARDVRAQGGTGKADEIDEQIAAMRRHVERELMRTRLAMHKTASCLFAPAAQRMITAMQRLPRGGELDWQNLCVKDLRAPLDEQDAAELLGNLCDNARIWARATVRVSGSVRDGAFRLSIEDDGPGIAEDQITRVLERGERLDRSKKGSGLGLAIANDIVKAYDGQLALGASELGGLKVSITLPVTNAATAGGKAKR